MLPLQFLDIMKATMKQECECICEKKLARNGSGGVSM